MSRSSFQRRVFIIALLLAPQCALSIHYIPICIAVNIDCLDESGLYCFKKLKTQFIEKYVVELLENTSDVSAMVIPTSIWTWWVWEFL
jgi:hypothetical protein